MAGWSEVLRAVVELLAVAVIDLPLAVAEDKTKADPLSDCLTCRFRSDNVIEYHESTAGGLSHRIIVSVTHWRYSAQVNVGGMGPLAAATLSATMVILQFFRALISSPIRTRLALTARCTRGNTRVDLYSSFSKRKFNFLLVK